MMRIGRRDQVDGTAVGKVHEDLVSLGRRDHQASDLHRLRQIAGVPGDDEERPPIGEAQIEVAGVGGIQQAQPHHPGRHIGDRTMAPLTSNVSPWNPCIRSIMVGS